MAPPARLLQRRHPTVWGAFRDNKRVPDEVNCWLCTGELRGASLTRVIKDKLKQSGPACFIWTLSLLPILLKQLSSPTRLPEQGHLFRLVVWSYSPSSSASERFARFYLFCDSLWLRTLLPVQYSSTQMLDCRICFLKSRPDQWIHLLAFNDFIACGD